MAKHGIRKSIRHFGKSFWIRVQESSAVMYGLPIELDPDETGDRFALSPVISEVHKSTTVEGHGFAL